MVAWQPKPRPQREPSAVLETSSVAMRTTVGKPKAERLKDGEEIRVRGPSLQAANLQTCEQVLSPSAEVPTQTI